MLLAATTVLSGCVKLGSTTVLKPVERTPPNFSMVEMPDLERAGNLPELPEEVKRMIPEKVLENLAKEKLFVKVARASVETVGVLLLKGHVQHYNPGSRALRYFVPGGGTLAGRASLVVWVEFIDKNSGTRIAKASFKSEMTGGLFGGDVEDMYDAVVDEIVDFVKTHFVR
jgi:hypothetical protein